MPYLNLVLRFILMFGFLRSGLRLLWRLHRNPRVPLWIKLLIPLGLLYLVFPRDLVHDFLPGVGFLDDVLVLGLVLYVLSKLAQRFSLAGEPPRRKDAIEGEYHVLDDEQDTN